MIVQILDCEYLSLIGALESRIRETESRIETETDEEMIEILNYDLIQLNNILKKLNY